MKNQPIWYSYSDNPGYPELKENIAVEVAIIGAGITGISSAHFLKEKGVKTAVIEARSLGKGSTGQSTGNLYFHTDELISDLISNYKEEDINFLFKYRNEALDKIEEIINSFQINCDFHRVPAIVFQDGNQKVLFREYKALNQLGISYSQTTHNEVPVPHAIGYKLAEQAQFNPLIFVEELANKINSPECLIFENSPVREIQEKEGNVILKTDKAKVTAKYVIQATHTPKGIELQYHSTLGPYREYGVCYKLNNKNVPPGIFWGYFGKDKFSFRSYQRGDEQFLIVIGQPHKVGQFENNDQKIKQLIDFAQEHFEVGELLNVWGGQNYKSADLFPFIGRKSDNSNQYVASGFSTSGLVYGSMAADLITREIISQKPVIPERFKASRSQPVKSAKNFLKENINTASQVVKDLLSKPELDGLDKIEPGEGKILKINNKTQAVYKNSEGLVTSFSAKCPHMGCIVHWNTLEKSWDCPCHGSRFSISGEVIEGPALNGLENPDT